VSKPVVPPWHDGSKNLVRDVASHLSRARPTVLVTDALRDPLLGDRVRTEAVYRSAGRFAPSVTANARVLARLLAKDPHDLWHFVFAPNPASSTAGRVARAVRRSIGWRGKVVQTVASAPRDFDGVKRLLFGDVVVVLSEWMRARLLAEGVSGDLLRVLPPCAAAPKTPSPAAIERVRERYDLGDAKVVLYPGDYEVSTGATTFADAIESVARSSRETVFVFACREKTAGAGTARARVMGRIASAGLSGRVRHVGEVDDLHTLLAASAVVAFPVDDLYGKVDLPLVLLEALSLGVPMVLARGGPLETLTTASFVDPGDGGGLAASILTLLEPRGEAEAHRARGRELYERTFAPQVVADRYDALYEEMTTGTP
jgi:phosphatidylinositol alpha-1,6-mannosyltransferase